MQGPALQKHSLQYFTDCNCSYIQKLTINVLYMEGQISA